MNKAEKSLRWVVNQIPDFKPTTNEEKMLVAIKLYSEAGAEEIKRLESENAALRERLEKTIEAPCEYGDIFYRFFDCPIEMVADMVCGFRKDKDGKIYVSSAYSGSWYDIKECEFSREAAEARLAELEERRNDIRRTD